MAHKLQYWHEPEPKTFLLILYAEVCSLIEITKEKRQFSVLQPWISWKFLKSYGFYLQISNDSIMHGSWSYCVIEPIMNWFFNVWDSGIQPATLKAYCWQHVKSLQVIGMVTDNITVLVNDPFISLQAGPCNTSNNLWIQFTHLFDPKKLILSSKRPVQIWVWV